MKSFLPKSIHLKTVAAALLFAGTVQAQSDPTLSQSFDEMGISSLKQIPLPGASAEDPGLAGAGGAFGTGSQDYWILATNFKARTAGADLDYGGFDYWSAVGGIQYEAQVELPAGAVVDILECFFFDSDAAASGSVGFWESQYDYVLDSPAVSNITTVTTSGSAGYQKPFASGINKTLRFRDGDNRNIYILIANLDPGNANIRFRGCRIFWHRQVSPPPGLASFNDVPTSDPFFKSVEALAASGITGGCGGGNFCPNNPVTREQMAAFLARALGLHWPY